MSDHLQLNPTTNSAVSRADEPTPSARIQLAAPAGRQRRVESPAFGRYPQYTRGRMADFAKALAQQIYPQWVAPRTLQVAGPLERITPAEALQLDYEDAESGRVYGPLWATFWFKLSFELPTDWAGRRVDLHWSSNSEALLWRRDADGQLVSVQGLNPGQQNHPPRTEAQVTPAWRGGETVELFVEMACNRLLGFNDLPGRSTPPSDAPAFRLNGCELRLFDSSAWKLYHDFEVLRSLEADHNPPQHSRSNGGTGETVRPALDRAWQGKLLRRLNDVCNFVDPTDRSTWPGGEAILSELLDSTNGSVAHEVSACGHAHIDTAWLWPLAETHRKCQRTFSSVLAYMERYPDFVFACPQAYQYRAIKRDNPDLYRRILEKVEAGRWIPVGGSWVEPDCNLPSGEAMCRQFLYGQQFFQVEFGMRSSVFWNPDVFGYNPQLPQLIRHAGMKRFLTQKLSWNKFTSPLHHTFQWRGLDGSAVLTHFPPADTYNGVASVDELRYHAANYKDADRSSEGIYLFGLGDGGGGPSDVMLERLDRCGDLQGVPRVTQRSPEVFFDRLEDDLQSPPVIDGELYFELHRGTYTSHSELKRLNRRGESLLQELEFASVVSPDVAPSAREIGELWKDLLLQQFHDILPGSSIDLVNDLARETLQNVVDSATKKRRTLLGENKPAGLNGHAAPATPINTLAMRRREVVVDERDDLVMVEAEPLAAGMRVGTDATAVGHEIGDGFELENAGLRIAIDRNGTVTSIFDKHHQREALAGPANELLLFDDRPVIWDAWDVDPTLYEKPIRVPNATSAKLTRTEGLRATLTIERPLSDRSTIIQYISLDAEGDAVLIENVVDWHERHIMLKMGVDAAVRASTMTAETCFGAVERPTHQNTIADVARFEMPCHRWVDVSEFGYGVAILNDSKYGVSVRGGRMMLSLLRAPTYPDPEADQGEHKFTFAIKPHAGSWQDADVVEHAYRLNRAVRFAHELPDALAKGSLLATSGGSLIIDTIKPAENGDGVVVRCYESRGGRGVTRIGGTLAFTEASLSNALEDAGEALDVDEDGCVSVKYEPFQIITLRLRG